ncbi:MAG: GNAT family N-acetyltransferase, partial [Pseudobdellovibrionaceae bacterium]
VESIGEDRNHYWIHKAVPRFETERLLIREISLEDAPSYQRNFADWEIIRNLAKHVPWPYPENGAFEFIKNILLPQQGKERWWWGLFLKDQPEEIIGVVEFYRDTCPDNRGFWLAKKHWGKGLMIEAVQPLTDYAFTQLGFEKLILSNALGNDQSRKIKEKGGAKFLGLKSGEFVDPSFSQLEMWEITKESWLENKG